MTAHAFKVRFGWDANHQKGVNLADCDPLQPEDAVNVRMLRRLSSVGLVARERDLPAPVAEPIPDGKPYLVRLASDGSDRPHLMIWQEIRPAALGPDIAGAVLTFDAPTPAITGTLTPGFYTDQPVTGGGGTGLLVDVRVDSTGTISQMRVADPGQGGYSAGDFLVLDAVPLGAASGDIDVTVQAVGTVPGGDAQRGEWIAVDQELLVKALRQDNDAGPPVSLGDTQYTLERDHEEIKVFDTTGLGAWHTIFSVDQVKAWIASLSLFEGTVQEVGGAEPGAIELDELPNLWPLQQLGDLSKTSHYWVYVGQPGYVVQDAAAEKAEATASGKNFGDITVTPNIPLPAAPAAPVQLQFAVSGGQVEINKILVIQIAIDNNGVPEAYEVRCPVNGGLLPMDAVALAAQASTFWTQAAAAQGIPLTFTHNTGEDFLTVTPAAGVAFNLMRSQDGGTAAVGADLAGAVLQVGDWIQIANRGGDGSGTGANGGPPDLHYVRIGGDLLTKARGDMLYGLQAWAAGGFEQGSLVVHDQSIWRASRAIVPSDGAPGPQKVTILPGGSEIDQWPDGTSIDWTANAGAASGDYVSITGPVQPATAGQPFNGVNMAAGDHLVWSGNPGFTGTTISGLTADQGWIRYPAGTALPQQDQLQEIPNSVWTEVDLAGGLTTVPDDATLPPGAPNGELYFVISSAKNNGDPTIYMWDTALSDWVRVGGDEGTPLDLSGGQPLVSVGVPVGSVTMYAGITLPDGWLLCDGSTFDQTIYPDLARVLGSVTLPDLRGHFVKGAATFAEVAGYQQHPHTTGLPQNDFVFGGGPHTHSLHSRTGAAAKDGHDVNWGEVAAGGAGNYVGRGNAMYAGEGTHTHTLSGGDPETAPAHVVLAYIIKATDCHALLQS